MGMRIPPLELKIMLESNASQSLGAVSADAIPHRKHARGRTRTCGCAPALAHPHLV